MPQIVKTLRNFVVFVIAIYPHNPDASGMAFGTPSSVYHGYSELASISCCFTHIILSAIRDTNTSVASCVPSKTDTTSSFVFANGNTSCPKFQLHFHSNYGLQNLHLLLSRQRLCMEPGKPSAQRPSRMVFSFIQLRLVVWFKMTHTTMCNGSSVTGGGADKICPHHYR